jgi:ferredoxin
VFLNIDHLLARQDRSLDASLCIEMAETYLPVFEVYTEEDVARVEAEMLAKLDSFTGVVTRQEKHRPRDPLAYTLLSRGICPVITVAYQRRWFPDLARRFYASEDCVGCGTCATVCLSGRIEIVEHRPVWNEKPRCTYCFACIHFCPSRAVQLLKKKTAKRGRYHHTEISVQDIAAQKGGRPL